MTAGIVNYEDIDSEHKADSQHVLWSINFHHKAHEDASFVQGDKLPEYRYKNKNEEVASP